MTTFIGAALLGCIYFAPTIVAWGRKNHTASIFVLNLFLGWTVVAWIVALAMALWSNKAKGGVAPRQHSA